MKVSVTGAGGFVGGYVVRALLARPDIELVTASRSVKGPEGLPASARHVALDIDSVDPAAAFDLLGSPQVLIHLAWAGLPNYKSLHHLEHLPRQYTFLSGLIQSGLRSLTCVGTCFEYGMQSGELTEEMETRPSNPYGFAKDTLRRQLEFLRAQHPFALNWARLFYMYGEGQPATSLFTQFVVAGTRGDSHFRMSAGEQLRDFLPVGLIGETIVDLALLAPDNGVVNVCAGQPVSVRALVESWRRERAWNIELELGHYPYPDYEPMAFWGSSAKLRNALKPVPQK